jgi:hypothetical protein
MEHHIATWVVKVWQNRALGEYAPAWAPGEEHSPKSLFERLGTRGSQDCQARESCKARLTAEAETIPQLVPRLRNFASPYLIQEQWHSPNRPVSINHLRPVRHQNIQLSPQPCR